MSKENRETSFAAMVFKPQQMLTAPSGSKVGPVRLGYPVVVIVAAILLQGCVSFQRLIDTQPHHKNPNIILIVLDTLRADHMSCYGYPLKTSPNLDRFRERSTFFTRAQSPASWTLPGHASLFTGLYPLEHGAYTFIPEEELNHYRIREKNLAPPLAPEFTTIAEYLRDRGYKTSAICANNIYLQRHFGTAQGFENYTVNYQYGEVINNLVMEWTDRFLSGAEADRPFFLFINYMDNHRPYNTNPVPTLFSDPMDGDSNATLNLLYKRIMPIPDKPPIDLMTRVNKQYDLGVANVDIAMGQLLDYFTRKLIYDDSLIIITSDHGEFLGEHFLVEHSKDVYQEVLWIPLMIKAPHQTRGIVEDRLISLVHIPPLILSFTELPIPECFPYRWPSDVIMGENHFARLKDINARWGYRFRRERYAVFFDFWKLIYSTDRKHELYRLDRDPKETHNLIEEHQEIAERLSRTAIRYIESNRKPDKMIELPNLTEEEKERMKSLGYL